jgi:hypothetical protein
MKEEQEFKERQDQDEEEKVRFEEEYKQPWGKNIKNNR